MKGSEWLLSLPRAPGAARIEAVLDAVRDGHARVDWVTLQSGPVEIEVSADALRVGDESDSVRIPVSAWVQQQIADLLDCVLPTGKICDLIWRHAEVRLAPRPQRVDDRSPAAYLAHHNAVEQAVAGRQGLVAGAGKDWAISRGIFQRPKAATNYGWHVPTLSALRRYTRVGDPANFKAVTFASDGELWVVQPFKMAHDHDHEDYSQKARLVRAACRVSGQASTIDAVLRDPALAQHLSHEGVLPGARMPAVPPPNHRAVVSAVGPRARGEVVVLRRGHVGEDVKEWQRIIGIAPDAAGTFGPKTEAATRAWQESHGFPPTGAVTEQQREIGRASAPDPDEAAPPLEAGVDLWIPATNFTKASRKAVSWAILHSTENDIVPGMARRVATFFANQTKTQKGQSSSHYVIGPDQIVQCVEEPSVAWAAPGANALGIQLELVGRGGPKLNKAGEKVAPPTNWEKEGRPVLERAAPFVGRLCRRWSIPLTPILDAEELLEREPPGITLHSVVTDASLLAFKRNLTTSRFYPSDPKRLPSHQDPGGPKGKRWPMDLFIELASAAPD